MCMDKSHDKMCAARSLLMINTLHWVHCLVKEEATLTRLRAAAGLPAANIVSDINRQKEMGKITIDLQFERVNDLLGAQLDAALLP